MNIRLLVCEFEPQISTFYLESALLVESLILMSKPRFYLIRYCKRSGNDLNHCTKQAIFFQFFRPSNNMAQLADGEPRSLEL